MAKSGLWPVAHATSIATFFFNLEAHQEKDRRTAKKSFVYQSHVRRECFNALKCNEGFNIELIQDDLLRSFAEEINDTIQTGKTRCEIGNSTRYVPCRPHGEYAELTAFFPFSPMSTPPPLFCSRPPHPLLRRGCHLPTMPCAALLLPPLDSFHLWTDTLLPRTAWVIVQVAFQTDT